MEEYASNCVTVNKDIYFDIRMRRREAIKKDCENVEKILLMQDNATPHEVVFAKELQMGLVPSSCIFSTLTLSDFHLFPALLSCD